MKEIKNYAVQMYSGPEGSTQGIRAKVYLFNEQNAIEGIISFLDAGRSLPQDTFEGGSVRMSMGVSMLPSVVDLLRNEKPIYLVWQEGRNRAILSTNQEPVGEGE